MLHMLRVTANDSSRVFLRRHCAPVLSLPRNKKNPKFLFSPSQSRPLPATRKKFVTKAALPKMPLKLHYFDMPGRAEVSRLCLTIGNVPYEEVNYEFKTWPEHKAKMPFGQVPVLELDNGKWLAQSGAIERYTAKLAGLYPVDPLEAALADQVVFHMADIFELFAPTFRLSPEEKVKARQEILATKAKEKFQQLSKILETSGEYVAGDKLSYGDIVVFVGLSNIISGFLDGVPKDLLKEYPTLKTFHNKIASIPAIKEYYEKRGEGYRAAFKPDTA